MIPSVWAASLLAGPRTIAAPLVASGPAGMSVSFGSTAAAALTPAVLVAAAAVYLLHADIHGAAPAAGLALGFAIARLRAAPVTR